MIPHDRERSPVPLGKLLLRGLPVAVLSAAACAAAAGLLSNQREPVYEASALVLTRDSADAVTGGPSSDEEGSGVSTEALLVQSRDVLDGVAARLGGLSVDDVEAAIEVAPVEETNVLRVTATDDRPAQASRLADAVARAFVAQRRADTRRRARDAQRVLERQLDRLSAQSRSSLPGVQLRERIESLRVIEEMGPAAPRIVENAHPPAEPVRPRPRRDALFGGLFGLLLGCGLAAVWVAGDRRLRGPAEASDILGAPVLTTVSRPRGLRARRGAASQADEQAWRLVHLSLRHLHQEKPLRSVAITEVTGSEDRTVLASGLATTAAAAGEHVLLISLEPERNVLDAVFGQVVTPGLRAVLAGDATLPQAVSRRTDPHDPSRGLDLLLGQARNGSHRALAESPRLGDTVREAAALYELVVVDTPSLLERAEGVPVVSEADGTVVVVAERAQRDQLVALRERLEALDVPLVGVVIRRG